MNCKQCGKEYEAQRSTSEYCSQSCKKKFYRDRLKAVEERVPVSVPLSTSQNVPLKSANPIKAIKGKCWCCGKDIEPILVCCQECAWSGKAAEKRAGAYPPLLTDRSPRQMDIDLSTLKFTGGYKMTDFENENYVPAEFLDGRHNPVSKPGDASYERN